MVKNMQTVNEWQSTPLPLLQLPDDANPAEAYPAHLIGGTLPLKGQQMILNTYNRLNGLATAATSLFKRPQGSVSGT